MMDTPESSHHDSPRTGPSPRKSDDHDSDTVDCQTLFQTLCDYVDGEAEASLCQELEKHLGGCEPCRAVIDQVRQTVTLFKGEQVYELPAPCRDRLHRTLREKWERDQRRTQP